MIYNFNLGIGWASSGVEYAQLYRARMFRNIKEEARFIFTDMFLRDNLIEMTRNIGFLDEEIIWLYTFFTDFKPEPVSYTLQQLKSTLPQRDYNYSRSGAIGYIDFGNEDFYRVYFSDKGKDLVHRVEIVQKGFLIRKDYYTSGRIFSEYYGPLDNQAHLYQRRFFNRDGSVAYEEITDRDEVMYKFKNQLICSKEELIGYMVKSLNLTSEDIVIIDRTTGTGQAILENAGPAKVGIVVHADHFSESATDDKNILWNNYYEYVFGMHECIDFYVTATDAQNELLLAQFEKYLQVKPKVFTIPVGSLAELKIPKKPRKKHSFITASRLANEKHIDWLIDAVSTAQKQVEDISLDIYGKGAEEERLSQLIKEKKAEKYIRLMGQHDLTDVYTDYEAYLSGSTSEGFGLTLMEAVGSGLPIIGFDVRYGNQEFIDDGENGYKLPYVVGLDSKLRQQRLVDAIIKLCTQVSIDSFSEKSYEKAKKFLTGEVEDRWTQLIRQII